MNGRLLALPLAGVLAMGAAPAFAQEPASGAAGYKLTGGLATKKVRYYAPAQQVVMRGRVTPAVRGEILTLYAIRRGKATKKIRRRVRNGGRFEFSFKVGKPGLVRLVVKHRRSAAQQAFRTERRMIQVADWQAGLGERGLKVLLLQRALVKEGFAAPVTGYYDDATSRAVLAFRKTNELGRDSYALKQVYAMLMRGEGAFKLRYPKAGENGKHVEFDWSRQVVVLARRGKPYRTYHTSSGSPATPTVFGSYRFYLKTPGTNSLGMVHAAYFIGGYAIHGYKSVPNYPASHGCLRVPIPNALSIFDWIDIGDPIFTYR
jgi:peptidoglycan hydrolase-like protein with peptidoglycan-binding domain